MHREELLCFLRDGMTYVLHDQTDPRPLMYFLAWGLVPFTDRVGGTGRCPRWMAQQATVKAEAVDGRLASAGWAGL